MHFNIPQGYPALYLNENIWAVNVGMFMFLPLILNNFHAEAKTAPRSMRHCAFSSCMASTLHLPAPSHSLEIPVCSNEIRLPTGRLMTPCHGLELMWNPTLAALKVHTRVFLHVFEWYLRSSKFWPRVLLVFISVYLSGGPEWRQFLEMINWNKSAIKLAGTVS